MNVLLLVVVSIAALILKWYLKYFRFNRYISKYNGPTPLPIIGNIHNIGLTDRFRKFSQHQREYGKIFTYWAGSRPRLMISDPQLIKCILGSTTALDKSTEYRFMEPWLGTGLLTCPGSTWQKQRKVITPAFHFQILEQFVNVFNAQSKILVDKLNTEVDNGPFDIFHYMSLCALDIICEAAMGTQINAQVQSDSKYVYSVKEMCATFIRRSYSPIKSHPFLYKFTEDYKKQKELIKTLHGYTNFIIDSRKRELFGENSERKDDANKRPALLDLLLKCRMDGESLSDEAIRQEVDTFTFEGHDTTASGLSFALYNISRHPEVQEKVVQEIREFFGTDRNRAPTYNELQEMKYLEMVIKESLRLHPSVPHFARTLNEDIQFEGDVLPKGLTLAISAIGLHRQEEYFPNAEVFDPERFSVENSANRMPFTYIPFSAGPRNCIGQRFAMLEMKSMISTVLRHFELLPVVDHEPDLLLEIVLKSSNGLLVQLRDREF